jgi:hypothetical protein
LKNIYSTETNEDVRGAVLDTLAAQRNSGALTDLAHNERDAAMKAEILRRLATIK